MIYRGVLEFLNTIEPGHAKRVSRWTYRLAKVLGLPENDCTLLAEAAHYHDIGKIAVPMSILGSKEKLAPREMEMIRQHVDYGLTMLSMHTGPTIDMARTIIATHHERYDGGGYPSGLRGEAIPLCGRMVALCDVFDALVSTRSYKEPWPLDKALKHIRDSSGILFDPTLIEPFCSCVLQHHTAREEVII